MPETPEIAPEMHLFSPEGHRLYLSAPERSSFLVAASHEEPIERMFCHVLHYTGCRPTEALQLIVERVHLDESCLLFRSLKKRKLDNKGRKKQPQFRSVPIPGELMEHLDLVFGIRSMRTRQKEVEKPLWVMSRPTAYRLVKRVMDRAGIIGKQAKDLDTVLGWQW